MATLNIRNALNTAWLRFKTPDSTQLKELADVTADSPAVGDFLKWDGSSWTSGSGATSGSGGDGTDDNAIHVNVSGEVNTLTEKTTIADDDLFVIEDSEASYAKKKFRAINLPTSGSGGGTGDMLKATYDADNDGIVDNSEALEGHAASYFAVSGHTHDETTITSGSQAADKALMSDGAGGAYWGDAGSSGTDTAAIHDNVSGEINALTTKTAHNNDIVVIEDSQASWAKKKLSLYNILSVIGGVLFAPENEGVYNGNNHRHSNDGVDGGQIWHGDLFNLTSDDHPQYHHSASMGRLSLTSGQSVGSAAVTNGTTLYYVPHNGNKFSLYDGTRWNLHSVTSQRSKALSGTAANTNYDVFMYLDDFTWLTLELTAWSSATARATALTTQDGILVKSGAVTRRYIGTIRTTGAGQSSDNLTQRYVWNYMNRVDRELTAINTTAHDYNGAARLWNNSTTNNLVGYVCGVDEDAIDCYYRGAQKAGADGNYAVIAYYLDGAEISTGYRIGNFNAQQIVGGVSFSQSYVGIGYHYASVYELGNHASSNFANMMIGMKVRC